MADRFICQYCSFPIINLIIMKLGQRLELKLSSAEPEVTEPVSNSHKSRLLHFQPLRLFLLLFLITNIILNPK